MKKRSIILTLTTILFFLSGFAQDRLVRVDSASIASRQKDLPSSLYAKELNRLFVPQNSQFGVIRATTFQPESSLTYDSVEHKLVYTRAWSNVYQATSEATTRNKRKGKSIIKVPRKRIHKYHAPGVFTYTLAINDEQARELRKKWTDAIQNAENKEDFVLDGTTWDFFIGNQRAESYDPQNAFVMYTNELMDSVFNSYQLRDAQNSYMAKIRWKSKDSLEKICFADTSQMKNRYTNGASYPFCETKELTIQGARYYCCFESIGSGLTIFLIHIFKQEKGQWEKVAEGRVTGPNFITANYDSHNNRIVFSELIPKMNTYTRKIKSLTEVREIGGISFSDL